MTHGEGVAAAERSPTAASAYARPTIGTLRERPLHAGLKRWYARPGDATEVSLDGFVIDVVRGDLLIEIQTRSFSSMRRKVAALLRGGHRLRIVHPIALDTWIVKRDADGVILGRRRSPRHGSPVDAFDELVSVADLLGHPRLEFDLVLVEIEEDRCHAPDGPWRRRGWRVVERRLLRPVETLALRDPMDFATLLPSGLPDRFTTADLAGALRRPRRLAQRMAYCLRRVHVIDTVGKRGHAIAYTTRAPSSGGPRAHRQ